MTWLSAWPSPDICSRAVAGIAAEALKQLLDRELPLKERQHIRDKLQACPEARVLHDLRTRHSGDRAFVEFHLEAASHLTITQGTPSATRRRMPSRSDSSRPSLK